jgi:hypothetical protein
MVVLAPAMSPKALNGWSGVWRLIIGIADLWAYTPSYHTVLAASVCNLCLLAKNVRSLCINHRAEEQPLT